MKLKQRKNLFNSLIKDDNGIFYSTDKINRSLNNKARRSIYPKDGVFIKLYNELEDKNNLYINKNNEFNLLLYTPFVEQRKNIDPSTLYSFKGPFRLLHADVADIRFLGKLAVDPKYFLLLIDIFTCKTYIYSIKKKDCLKRISKFSTTIFPRKSKRIRK